MDETTIIDELIIDGYNFDKMPLIRYSSDNCNCSNTNIIKHKYKELYIKYIKNGIINVSEFKEYKLKLVKIICTPPIYSDKKCIIKEGVMKSNENNEFIKDPYNCDTLWIRQGIGQNVYNITHSLYYMNHNCDDYYICDVELTTNSKIKMHDYAFIINEYEIRNERKITIPELVSMINDICIHDYMYIDTHIADCNMCAKTTYNMRRRCSRQDVMKGKYFRNKNLKYIYFEKLNIMNMADEFRGLGDDIIKFIEISDFNKVRYMAYTKNINMVDFMNDYIYDVEIQEDSLIYKNNETYYSDDKYRKCESVCIYKFNNSTIKLINKRKLIDDLLLLSYLYYNLFEYESSINEQEFNNVFFRNIFGYFVEDTQTVKINKMIDLFFNSRAYLLEMNRRYANIDVYILSLFNTKYEPMKEECNKQCIEFIKSLLDTIMNRKHILIKNFSDEELKKLYDRIIECITINKCVETNIIETLGIQFEKLKIKDGL